MGASWSCGRKVARLGDFLVIEFLLLDCHDLVVELNGKLRFDLILFITSFSRISGVV